MNKYDKKLLCLHCDKQYYASELKQENAYYMYCLKCFNPVVSVFKLGYCSECGEKYKLYFNKNRGYFKCSCNKE